MPLAKAKSNSKADVNAAIGKNISELSHYGTKKRSHKQIVAIAIQSAKDKNAKYKKSTKGN